MNKVSIGNNWVHMQGFVNPRVIGNKDPAPKHPLFFTEAEDPLINMISTGAFKNFSGRNHVTKSFTCSKTNATICTFSNTLVNIIITTTMGLGLLPFNSDSVLVCHPFCQLVNLSSVFELSLSSIHILRAIFLWLRQILLSSELKCQQWKVSIFKYFRISTILWLCK